MCVCACLIEHICWCPLLRVYILYIYTKCKLYISLFLKMGTNKSRLSRASPWSNSRGPKNMFHSTLSRWTQNCSRSNKIEDIGSRALMLCPLNVPCTSLKKHDSECLSELNCCLFEKKIDPAQSRLHYIYWWTMQEFQCSHFKCQETKQVDFPWKWGNPQFQWIIIIIPFWMATCRHSPFSDTAMPVPENSETSSDCLWW